MLKYKGFELKEESIKTEGTELLIAVENKSNMEDEDFEDLLWEEIEFLDGLYVECQDDNYFEIRSDKDFTFDKKGVDTLKSTCRKISKKLKDKANVTIGVYAGQFVFQGEDGKNYNQDNVTLDEFERNIEIN